MNVFQEFHKIVKHLQTEKIEYALIGGVAVAFYTEPRFTKDIDILLRKKDFEKMKMVLDKENYFESSPPWVLQDCGLTLHRFLKSGVREERIIDVLVVEDERHDRIITDARDAVSEETGVVRVARKDGLIWLKRQRNSKQDQADIDRLKNEEPE